METLTKIKYGTTIGSALLAIITAGYVWMSDAVYISQSDYFELFQGVQERGQSSLNAHLDDQIVPIEIEQAQWYPNNYVPQKTWKSVTNDWTDLTHSRFITNYFPYYTNRLVEYLNEYDEPYWANIKITTEQIDDIDTYDGGYSGYGPVKDIRIVQLPLYDKQIVSTGEYPNASWSLQIAQCWTNVAITNNIENYVGDLTSYNLIGHRLSLMCGAERDYNNNFSLWCDYEYSGSSGIGRFDGLDTFPRYNLGEMFTRANIPWSGIQPEHFYDLGIYNDYSVTQQMVTVSNWVEKYMVARECKWMNGFARGQISGKDMSGNYVVIMGSGSTWIDAKNNLGSYFDVQSVNWSNEVPTESSWDVPNSSINITVNSRQAAVNATYGRIGKDNDDNIIYVAIQIFSSFKLAQRVDLDTNLTAKIDWYVKSVTAPQLNFTATMTYSTYGNGTAENKLQLYQADWNRLLDYNYRPLNSDNTSKYNPTTFCDSPYYDGLIAKHTGEGNMVNLTDYSNGNVSEIIKWDYIHCVDPSVGYLTPTP